MFDRIANVGWHHDHPNLVFWASFLTLNAFLFLPLYLLSQETATFLPIPTLFADGSWEGINQLFIWRENLDIFRISVEFTVLTALWVTVRWLQRPLVRYLFIVLYLLALAYYVYEAIMVSIYLLDPNFYSQGFLARDGLPFLLAHVQTAWWTYAATIAGLVVGIAVIVGLINLLLAAGAAPTLRRASRVVFALLAGLCVSAALIYQIYTATPEMVVSSLGFKVQKNIAASTKLYTDVASFDDKPVRAAYNYVNYPLAKKPNIYLIFVESYGSVLYKRPDYRKAYTTLLAGLEKEFEAAGWHEATALSESPTWGGGSWLSYTTVLSGLRVDNHPQYLSLFNKYQVETYPNLGRTLQAQGYQFVWLSALTEDLMDRAWARYTRFYGVDELIRNEQLGYGGPRYGWGPAPPDQYDLNYANEMVKSRGDKPLFLFTITQNSHYPWVPHPTLVDDWRTLNQPQPEDAAVDPKEIAPATMRQNYLHAIQYQLPMLTDFILHNGDDNSLFVLIGDHQPPAVSRRTDGWSTPVHIISKDKALIDSLAEYGFVPGLTVSSLEPTLHHEGIYSMLMRTLVEQYGVDKLALPAYLPRGAVSDSLTQSMQP